MYLMLFALTFAMPWAQADIWEDLKTNPQDAEVRIFKELSKIPRPSHGEEGVRAFLVELKSQASERLWHQPLVHEIDPTGNLLIRLPGTGKHQKESPVALQSHMDMVICAKNNAVQIEARVLHEGVRVAETDGWLHSENCESTLGADNGIGMALALRYLIDPKIEHPPLELVFTMDEEQGMTGAKKMALDLQSKVLINLDSESADMACRGCIAGGGILVEGNLLEEQASPDNLVTEVKISGFPGGHSGVEMWDDRPSAILFAVEIMQSLILAHPGIRFAQLAGGGPKRINAIPDIATFTLTSPRAIRAEIEQTFARAKQKLSQKNQLTAAIEIRERAQPVSRVFAASVETRILNLLLDLKDQIVTWDASYPHGVLTSSNLGYVEFKTSDSLGPQTVKLAILGRSFNEARLKELNESNATLLHNEWPAAFPPKVEMPQPEPPWLAEEDNWLVRLLKQVAPNMKAELEAGGLETSIFVSKYPGIEMISIGPDIENPHSPNERLRLASVPYISGVLEKLLQKIGPANCGQVIAGATP